MSAQFTTVTTDPVQPAVDMADLAEWLVVDAADPILPMVATMATSMAIEFLESELLTRSRTTVYQEWPYLGTVTRPSLSRNYLEAVRDVELPYGVPDNTTITLAEASGEAIDASDYTVQTTKPVTVRLPGVHGHSGYSPALRFEYTAGYGTTTEDVPQPIRLGIMALAAVLYEHRGGCDAVDAFAKSGAAALLQPYRLRPVAL